MIWLPAQTLVDRMHVWHSLLFILQVKQCVHVGSSAFITNCCIKNLFLEEDQGKIPGKASLAEIFIHELGYSNFLCILLIKIIS